ncbi:MAG: thiamine pyrophosphate-dependent enzyme, partial [Acetobacterium sp.]|nr:thiamine pyrophosphate-dependent enzyme [Acetobacterium sp.]
PVENHINIENISDRSEAYNIPGLTIDGNDFLGVYNTATKALRYARAGKGPVLIEAKTYRYSGHSKSDKQLYRDKRELLEWQKKDPLLKMKEYLRENRVFTEKQILKMEEEARVSIEQAVEFAQKSPQPELTTILEDVYA